MCRWLQRSFIHFLLLCFHLSTCFYLIKLKQIHVGFVMLTSIFLFFCYFAFFFSVRVSAFFLTLAFSPIFMFHQVSSKVSFSFVFSLRHPSARILYPVNYSYAFFSLSPAGDRATRHFLIIHFLFEPHTSITQEIRIISLKKSFSP